LNEAGKEALKSISEKKENKGAYEKVEEDASRMDNMIENISHYIANQAQNLKGSQEIEKRKEPKME
jgi:hypothetical protein